MFIQPIIYARVPTEHFTFIRTDAAARNRHLLRLLTWRAQLAPITWHEALELNVTRLLADLCAEVRYLEEEKLLESPAQSSFQLAEATSPRLMAPGRRKHLFPLVQRTTNISAEKFQAPGPPRSLA